jgi:hypothetical protein
VALSWLLSWLLCGHHTTEHWALEISMLQFSFDPSISYMSVYMWLNLPMTHGLFVALHEALTWYIKSPPCGPILSELDDMIIVMALACLLHSCCRGADMASPLSYWALDTLTLCLYPIQYGTLSQCVMSTGKSTHQGTKPLNPLKLQQRVFKKYYGTSVSDIMGPTI